MHLTLNDFKKYILFVLLFIWFVLFAHLGYIYVSSFGEEKSVKGGIFLEGVVNQAINPMPYLGNNYHSKYVQSILFRSCLDSFGSGDLCNVSTNDYKVFDISLSGDNYWSDGRQITLDDVFFTYNDIIKNNSLGLANPVSSSISSVELKENKVLVTFSNASINNIQLFKKAILPVHKLKGVNLNNMDKFLQSMTNSTCVKIDTKSDYKNNIILDYSKCKDYYIGKYQFILLPDRNVLYNFLTGNKKLDIYNGYENISPTYFSKHPIKLKKRYAFFWNTQKQTDNYIKTFLSKYIISSLKKDISLNEKLFFNGYGLFNFDENIKLDVEKFKKYIENKYKTEIESKIKKDTLSKYIIVNSNIINYKQGSKKPYYVKYIKDVLTINGHLLADGYEKVAISANFKKPYTLKSYNGTNSFTYRISEKYKNIKTGKNVYTIYGYKNGKKVLLGTIIIYYKKLPDTTVKEKKIEIKYPDVKILYLDKNLISSIGDNIANNLKNVYPGNIDVQKVSTMEEYKQLLEKKDYDIVVTNINFDGNDISSIFQTDNVLVNPSLFVNKSFASLIRQNLLTKGKIRGKVYEELRKMYQSTIPLVIIGNEKMYIFMANKYNFPDLDYSYFDNRKKVLKNVVLTKVKQPVMKNISMKGFLQFLKTKLAE